MLDYIDQVWRLAEALSFSLKIIPQNVGGDEDWRFSLRLHPQCLSTLAFPSRRCCLIHCFTTLGFLGQRASVLLRHDHDCAHGLATFWRIGSVGNQLVLNAHHSRFGLLGSGFLCSRRPLVV